MCIISIGATVLWFSLVQLNATTYGHCGTLACLQVAVGVDIHCFPQSHCDAHSEPVTVCKYIPGYFSVRLLLAHITPHPLGVS